MTETNGTIDTDERLLALENSVRVIRSELVDIRDVISQIFDVFSKSNDDRSHSIQILARHIEQIEERLEPAFNKAFPQHEDFLRETQAILDGRGKRQS